MRDVDISLSSETSPTASESMDEDLSNVSAILYRPEITEALNSHISISSRDWLFTREAMQHCLTQCQRLALSPIAYNGGRQRHSVYIKKNALAALCNIPLGVTGEQCIFVPLALLFGSTAGWLRSLSGHSPLVHVTMSRVVHRRAVADRDRSLDADQSTQSAHLLWVVNKLISSTFSSFNVESSII